MLDSMMCAETRSVCGLVLSSVKSSNSVCHINPSAAYMFAVYQLICIYVCVCVCVRVCVFVAVNQQRNHLYVDSP